MAKKRILIIFIVLFLAVLELQAQKTMVSIERISINNSGIEGNNASFRPTISADGRFVAFNSSATNLVANDSNAANDVFVYDRTNKTVERISINNSGIQGNDDSSDPTISADGRFVAFFSSATNLVANDTNNRSDIFVYDRTNKTIERASVTNSGIQGNGESSDSTISADGHFVVFYSSSTNLVPNDTNAASDIFVYDRTSATIERVSINNSGIQGNHHSSQPAISNDGHFVVFVSLASNLVANDTNNTEDVFVYDRTNQTIERVSVNNSGAQANDYSYVPSISGDGRFVTFYSPASNLVPNDTNNVRDVFVYDQTNKTIERVSVNNSGVQANNVAWYSDISDDGRFVTFDSEASNLVPNDTNATADVFIYNRLEAKIELISVNDSGIQGNDYSIDIFISADGRFVAFHSAATNLVANDTNNAVDIFFVELEITIAQDVNQDGMVSSTDAIYVINRLGSADLTADVDANGLVEAADVNAILDYLGN